jgi:hypothetical protein
MMLRYTSDGEMFAKYVATYNRAPYINRSLIVLSVEMADELTTAIVDTGIPFSICAPEWAELLGFTRDRAEDVLPVRIRGRIVHGRMHRMPVKILADDESPSDVFNVFTFVPDQAADLGEEKLQPFMLGLAGCLTSTRFGVDGNRQHFYWY